MPFFLWMFLVLDKEWSTLSRLHETMLQCLFSNKAKQDYTEVINRLIQNAEFLNEFCNSVPDNVIWVKLWPFLLGPLHHTMVQQQNT